MDPDLKPYLNDVFPARTCEDGCKYLRERLHILAWRMQCTASEMGKTGTEIASPILDKRKGSDDSPLRVIVLPLGK